MFVDEINNLPVSIDKIYTAALEFDQGNFHRS
jgi:hypothetical protein